MKGLELPINIIVIIVLAVVVLIAGLFLFMGSWQSSGGATQSESIFRSLCNQLLQKNCEPSPNTITTTISGKTYTLKDMCAQRGISGDDACKQACGCLITSTSSSSSGGQTCTDSDGGKDIYTKGTCKDSSGEHSDYCLGEDLVEYYCSNNICVTTAEYQCQCNDGKCRP